MKKFLIATLLLAPLMASASCENVKATINQKIIANGVNANMFSLDIVPNDQADKTDEQVVGHCDNDNYKIIYHRVGANTATNDSTTGTSE